MIYFSYGGGKMSAMELKAFKSQLDLLSYSEQLSVIEYLVKSLQNKSKSMQAQKSNSKSNWLSDTFKIMDDSPIFTNGKKWTREELYER